MLQFKTKQNTQQNGNFFMKYFSDFVKKTYCFVILFFLFCCFFCMFTDSGQAQEIEKKIGASGLLLPRFVSIKAERANARVGPGRNYPIRWLYQKQDLPVEIIQEYGPWRKVRDSEGQGGWIYQSLLSGKRTVLIAPWQKDKTKIVVLRKTPYENSSFLTLVEPGVVAYLYHCDGFWCEIECSNVRGFVKQNQLWGVYPKEIIR